MVMLVIQAEGEAPVTRELTAGTLTIGRKADNDVRLQDSTVSGHHAKIVTYFKASHVEDLGSTNGTFVNGRRVRMHTLRPGDVVAIGRHTITVQEEGSAAARPAPPPEPEHTTVLSRQELDHALGELERGADAAPDALQAAVPAGAYLRVMVGPNTGERLYLSEGGVQLEGGVVVRPEGERVLVRRGSPPAGMPVRLNSRELGPEPAPLKDMDMLQVGTTWLAFFAK